MENKGCTERLVQALCLAIGFAVAIWDAKPDGDPLRFLLILLGVTIIPSSIILAIVIPGWPQSME